ncbi:uncharacterized protein KGF55_000773 [Candida pseudojiufengensis]|uniref:uncharacterized protein n=1 Tax=Candida pseudojiufengensis TaxID=497109 RepID=UPI0022241EB2|nr:uncharacterized protein KGF55_000773 [Candida pseudojiufengensis]KAI5966464.1 hypothetical protein KGF55_000773 [Candida pseudojiufengensis]
MLSTLIVVLVSIVSLCHGRVFYLKTTTNAACLTITLPTTIEITKTIGQEPVPIVVFDYNHRNLFEELPNFDFLTTDAKIDEYIEYGEFVFDSPDSIYASKDELNAEPLKFGVTPGTWCIYSPKLSSYEYKVDVKENGYYERYDDLWWSAINIVVCLFLARLFNFGTNPPIIYKTVTLVQLAKVSVYLTSLIFTYFNEPVLRYSEYVVKGLDDIFTMLFLMGYGLTYGNYRDQNVKKIFFVTLLTVIPSFAVRYFDLKTNVNYIEINNQSYNVVQGVLGPAGYDGLNQIENITLQYKINTFSGPIALLFAISNFIKIVVYTLSIRSTFKKLKIINPKARKSYIYVVIIWLFAWSLISVALSPNLFYNYQNITNYANILNEYLIESLRSKYIIFALDESHWIIFWLLWYFGQGLLIDKEVDVVEVDSVVEVNSKPIVTETIIEIKKDE